MPSAHGIGTTASANPRGIFYPAHMGRAPGQGHPPLDPPDRATLRGSGPEQRIGELEDSERPEACGPGGATDK